MRALLALSLTGGCSFFATEGPREAPKPTSCNLEMKPVAADGFASAGAAVAASVEGFEHASTTTVAIPISIAAVFVASTVYGYLQVSHCRSEHARRPAWSLAEMPAVM